MQSDLLVSPKQYANNVRGEWRSLAASNVLLSMKIHLISGDKNIHKINIGGRFGVRERPYVVHEAKSASLAILHEMSTIWSAQVADAATHPFRETLHGESDFSTMFMMVHFVVERWRESLLWSWTVAKHGGIDDSWDEGTANAAWEDLGGTVGSPMQLLVKGAHRESLDAKRVDGNLKASGYKGADPTTYAFSEFPSDTSAYIVLIFLQRRKMAIHISTSWTRLRINGRNIGQMH